MCRFDDFVRDFYEKVGGARRSKVRFVAHSLGSSQPAKGALFSTKLAATCHETVQHLLG